MKILELAFNPLLTKVQRVVERLKRLKKDRHILE
jgi:hypothetical protein